MIFDRVVQEMKSNQFISTEHLCRSCVYAYYGVLLGELSIEGTTVDLNECELYARTCFDEDIPCATDKSTGNTRVYLNGFKTIDNGSGYWIIECPYYMELKGAEE